MKNLSKLLSLGAERIGHSLVYSAEMANQLILRGTQLIMENISPAEQDLHIPGEVLIAFDAVQEATGRAVEFSDFLGKIILGVSTTNNNYFKEINCSVNNYFQTIQFLISKMEP